MLQCSCGASGLTAERWAGYRSVCLRVKNTCIHCLTPTKVATVPDSTTGNGLMFISHANITEADGKCQVFGHKPIQPWCLILCVMCPQCLVLVPLSLCEPVELSVTFSVGFAALWLANVLHLCWFPHLCLISPRVFNPWVFHCSPFDLLCGCGPVFHVWEFSLCSCFL